MTEDIWAEKPQPMLHGVDLETYDAEELNAWLENLKSSFDESIADCHHSLELVAKKLGEYREKAEKWDAHSRYYAPVVSSYQHRIIKLTEKLEAVKKWHKAQIGREVDPQDIRELGEIMEDEG